jgi:hypothetical protein
MKTIPFAYRKFISQKRGRKQTTNYHNCNLFIDATLKFLIETRFQRRTTSSLMSFNKA